MPGENASGADNQQVTGEKISKDYLVGFVEGEGCFYVGLSKRKDLPTGWQVIAEFKVSQNPKGRKILEVLRERIGCGSIKRNDLKNKKDKTWILIVRKQKDLIEKVIPYFEGKLLVKKKEFEKFKNVLELMKKREHLKPKGIRKIVEIIYSSPSKRKKYSKEIILSRNLRDHTPDTAAH